MMRPSRDDKHPVANRQQLFKIRNRDNNRRARFCNFRNNAANVGFGANVDACRRFIEKEHPAIGGERATESNLLRIATAQLGDQNVSIRRDHGKGGDDLVGPPFLQRFDRKKTPDGDGCRVR